MEKPKILLLDEPMNALDENSVESTRRLLGKLSTEENVTVILTSLHQEDINLLCNEVYRIKNNGLCRETGGKYS